MKTLVDIPKGSLEAPHRIGGIEVTGNGGQRVPVVSPYTGQALGAYVPPSREQISSAFTAARTAGERWRNTPIKERTQTLLSFRTLLIRDVEALAHSAAAEAGKTISEAKAEVAKGVEVLEFACALQNLDAGGVLEVSRGVTCEYRREAVGVTVGITPFNFPAMVPMWMLPISLALGNAFILKPSDKVPFTSCLIGRLLEEAGLPAGVFSIIHGGKDVVHELVTHPGADAVAFVGSTPVARSVYAAATAQGKRALCLGGAKNHLILAPDADASVAVDGIVASFTGCAGQRCMAASVLVAVGDCDALVAKVVEAASRMTVGPDMGALIDRASIERLTAAVDTAAAQGAEVRLDGRKVKAPTGYEGGFWFGPTVLDNVYAGMECATRELFGPVLSIVRVKTLEEALALESRSPYGNATSIFTTSGGAARYVAERSSSGMIGVNIGVPVPREPFSFGGTKESKFGCGDITGAGGVEFWSNRKKITSKWAPQSDRNWMS